MEAANLSSQNDDEDIPSPVQSPPVAFQQPSQCSEETPGNPILSVLNIVVDYAMVPPTPMEMEEYQESVSQATKTDNDDSMKTNGRKILVPIMRVFGPIIRSGSNQEPLQSCCLHIHGAFPYLLARPAIAGPDGSLHHAAHLDSQFSSGNVNWDDADSVGRIVDELQTNLEAALQSSMEVSSKKDDSNENGVANNVTNQILKPPRVIRRISVIVGRGFYTFCPGPAAPFLRVEYYDPKLRWKVKLMLERGLELPLMYHPDAQQYETSVVPPANDINTDALKFHCYEAHIPYTMQFFKDYNLAGMSYIHIGKGKFRRPLPKTSRQRPSPSSSGNPKLFEENLFLSSNISSDLLWSLNETSEDNVALLNKATNPELSSFTKENSELFWTKKETTCDVEFDASTCDILNVNSVMTSLPDSPSEREQVHWRAVPSLREIWRQERQRMARLLKPSDDFLTHLTSSSQSTRETALGTKTKKKEKDVPFTLNVKRGASIPGARLAVAGMENLFKLSKGLEQDYHRAMSDIVNRHANAVVGVDDKLRARALKNSFKSVADTPVIKTRGAESTDMSTPTMDEAIEALGALEGQFEGSDQATPIGGKTHPCNTPTNVSASPHKKSSELSPDASLDDLVAMSQRVDEGNEIVGMISTQENQVNHIEDLINPETLTPYEDPEDLEDAGFASEEEEMDEKEFEQTLTMLATQNPVVGPDTKINGDGQARSNEYNPNNHFDTQLTQSGIEVEPASPLCVIEEYDSDDTEDDIANQLIDSGNSKKRGHQESLLDSSSTRTSILTTQDHQKYGDKNKLNLKCGQVLERQSYAPTRSELSGGDFVQTDKIRPLYPLERTKNTAPAWLQHVSAYHMISLQSRQDGKYQIDPLCMRGGTFLEPVKRPPSRGKVLSWSYRKRPREPTGHTDLKETKERASSLRIDENSRKLTAVPNTVAVGDTSKRQENSHTLAVAQEVEEVLWHDDVGTQSQSQAPPLSMTQNRNVSTPGSQSRCSLGDERIREGGNDQLSPLTPGSNRKGTKVMQRQSLPMFTSTSTPSPVVAFSKTESQSQIQSDSQSTDQPLDGIGNQGGRIYVQGGGGLKAQTRSCIREAKVEEEINNPSKSSSNIMDLPSPMTVMAVEIHVQCRTGRAGVSDSKEIAMKPNSDKDAVFAVMYVFGRDPGGGEALQIQERGCLVSPVENEKSGNQGSMKQMASALPKKTMGISSKLVVEAVRDERHLLIRFASIVQWKDPDMLLSWDPQGGGLGYLIERGHAIGKVPSEVGGSQSTNGSLKVDLVRLLGRTPRARKTSEDSDKGWALRGQNVDSSESGHNSGTGVFSKDISKGQQQWEGSGLGNEWDDRVGAGAAAASIVGRLVFSGWKIVAEEVKHPNSSYLPAMVATVLSKRIPYHDDLQLTRWYAASKGKERWRVLNHRLVQGVACLLLFDALDVIGRAGEAARLSGVEFSQSFPGIRGSQYKVEGVLLRALKSIQSDERGTKRGLQKTKLSDDPNNIGIDSGTSLSNESTSQTQSPWKMRRNIAKKKMCGDSDLQMDIRNRSYFFYSPSIVDSSRQEALECQAMTLEPQSGFFQDPVVVCDFTALYPSLVIAYNLCYSTCAGKLDYHSTRQEMRQSGKTTGRLGPFYYSESRTATVLSHHMKSLEDKIKGGSKDQSECRNRKDRAYVAPTGTIFLSEAVLKGVLPQVLDEMLSTRAMLKKAAKEYKRLVPDLSPAILRQLEARQLALKYVANVTYGYTSATFSGRCAMPLVADAIVECGRRTLSNAINLANQWGIEKNGRWCGAEVIYGDTDSIFVKLPGRSVKEAFEFGKSFCKAVTASNPPPVQLKLEKVYSGSLMQTKKKYCGMKYESADQKKPVFEAKGIETVRRDQCALTQKVLRNALVTLFRSGLEAVRSYLYRQWGLILAGRLPVSDFILTGRVRSRYRGGRIGPVQAVLARRMAEADPGRIIRHKERLPYVITATPGLTFRLRDCVLAPTELLEQWDAYSIHSVYYITRHVNAALQRCLGLAPYKVDVNSWYEACPKPRRRIHFWPVTRSGSSVMISSYFGSDVCGLCGNRCKAKGSNRAVVCGFCQRDSVRATLTAMEMLNKAQKDAHAVAKICSVCNGGFESAETFAATKTLIINQAISRDGPSSVFAASRNKTTTGIVTPIANCSCIDCPKTYERHRLRESELEATEICKALDLFN